MMVIKMNKILTIITVTYNSGKTLQRTIDSISTQKTDAIEYIVIDGGSTDDTLEIIKRNEPFIDKWISEKDNGIYDAMNKGITLSSGKFIAFMNSDDWFEDRVLTTCLPTLTTSQASIVYGNTNIWSGSVAIGTRQAGEIIPGKIPLQMPFSHQSCFINRNVMGAGFNLTYKLVADFEMIISILKNPNVVVERLPYSISGFSIGGASSNIMKSAKERLQIHKKHGLFKPLAYALYFRWVLIALIKKFVSSELELKLRRFKTRHRL